MGASILLGLLLAGSLGCRAGGESGETVDSARGAPPEPQLATTDSAARNPNAAADSQAAPRAPHDPGSPWPADTFDVRIDRFSFEEPAAAARIPDCGGPTPIIAGDSVGRLRAGMTRTQVEAACPRLHYGWYYSDDQRWIPSANVRLGGATVLVEFAGTAPTATVTRIAALDSVAKTADGLGAGTPLAEARTRLGEPTLVAAKCAVFARWPSRPGLIARIVLTDESGWECSTMRQVAERNNLARVPRDSRIGYFAHEMRD